MGVWIETGHTLTYDCGAEQSHPTWVCGLKPLSPVEANSVLLSHPTWVCGLKLVSCLICLAMVLSHPTWVCGLKRTLLVCYANL